MKHAMIKTIVAVAVAAAASGASAGVVQTFGAGSAVKTVTNAANFDANTRVDSNYVEDGLRFTYVGAGNNDGCGYAGRDCGLDPAIDYGPGFSGNYIATDGKPSYISIGKANGSDFYAVEFTAGTGYLNLNGYWQTYNDKLLTGSGKFSWPSSTTVLGLADKAGFDEVRYFAFSTANGAPTGFSAPAIDDVRVGVPEPATLALFVGSFAALAGARRKRRHQPG